MHELWTQMLWLWRSPEFRDVIDVLLVSFLVYEVLRLVRGTRAVQMAVGLGSVALLYQISSWLTLTTVQWVLRNAVVYLGFGVIVLFQREIRTALTHLGNNIRIPFTRTSKSANDYGQDWYDEVVLAATTLSSQKTGALIVFEREVGLKTYIESGVRLDARLTYDLLVTIFNSNAPLHDGAAIVSNSRLAAASCFLPLTQNPLLSRELGTRHRAAIGITEDSDACAVIVSEETGSISLAVTGRIFRHLDGPRLRRQLQNVMEPRRSKDEAAADEAEELRHRQQLDEIAAPRRLDSGAKTRSESIQEGTLL
ncbi:MAG: diadenylate cyclase CdaA [Acidobacteriota bacterium]